MKNIELRIIKHFLPNSNNLQFTEQIARIMNLFLRGNILIYFKLFKY